MTIIGRPKAMGPGTPSSTATPTPTPPNPELGNYLKFNGSFFRQRDNDRKYYRRIIGQMIDAIHASGKWNTYTPDERKARVMERRLELVQVRDGSPNMTTTGQSYPDVHDEKTEKLWLVKQFWKVIQDGKVAVPVRKESIRTKGKVYYEKSDEEDDMDGDDDEESLPKSKKEVEEEDSSDGSDEESDKETEAETSGRGKTTPQSKMAGEGVEVFSLSLRIKSGQIKTTKPFWARNENMELSLVMPTATPSDDAEGGDTKLKRKREELEGEAAKKIKRE